jgi:hypothetical protein
MAPGAETYHVSPAGSGSRGATNRIPYAEAIDHVLEVNRRLPPECRIRVISMSVGWKPETRGAAEVQAAIDRAKEQGVFVVSTTIERCYPGFNFCGLGREPISDPDSASS